jgi:hypothetical protein
MAVQPAWQDYLLLANGFIGNWSYIGVWKTQWRLGSRGFGRIFPASPDFCLAAIFLCPDFSFGRSAYRCTHNLAQVMERIIQNTGKTGLSAGNPFQSGSFGLYL